MKGCIHNSKTLGLFSLTVSLIVTLALTTHYSLASAQNKTLTTPSGTKAVAVATNVTNIVLVHGAWSDGSAWSQEIPILEKAGHRVIAVQLPEHSLADDVATVKRAIDLLGGPVILVGHSYGGMVISNAAYNNPKVKGLVYIAAFAPQQGQFFDHR
jgi:pimeloyl-ACP methyl ester carboxylesterase